jgi:hypothetical protein
MPTQQHQANRTGSNRPNVVRKLMIAVSVRASPTRTRSGPSRGREIRQRRVSKSVFMFQGAGSREPGPAVITSTAILHPSRLRGSDRLAHLQLIARFGAPAQAVTLTGAILRRMVLPHENRKGYLWIRNPRS